MHVPYCAITSEENTVYFWIFDGHLADFAFSFAAEVFGRPHWPHIDVPEENKQNY